MMMRMIGGNDCVDKKSPTTTRILLTGDVMLGRGVDQILPHQVDPILYEDYVKNARDYVALAIDQNGHIPEPVNPSYVWGDAIDIANEMKPNVFIINLETAITTSPRYWPYKGINYRMHPKNVNVIQAANVDCCVLSNNHVLDWGHLGLDETLRTLSKAKASYVGAGIDLEEAEKPAVFQLGEDETSRKVIIFGLGHESSGIPPSWAAGPHHQPGVNFIRTFHDSAHMARMAQTIRSIKGANDIVIVSIHWGGNWGFPVEDEQTKFAHKLIDDLGVDLVHGHSSHHVKGVEAYKGKLILYGCGDFINDYEGIESHPGLPRDDLSFMYFVDFKDNNATLDRLTMVPMRLKHMQVTRAVDEDYEWLKVNMTRECQEFDLKVVENERNNQLEIVFADD